MNFRPPDFLQLAPPVFSEKKILEKKSTHLVPARRHCTVRTRPGGRALWLHECEVTSARGSRVLLLALHRALHCTGASFSVGCSALLTPKLLYLPDKRWRAPAATNQPAELCAFSRPAAPDHHDGRARLRPRQSTGARRFPSAASLLVLAAPFVPATTPPLTRSLPACLPTMPSCCSHAGRGLGLPGPFATAAGTRGACEGAPRRVAVRARAPHPPRMREGWRRSRRALPRLALHEKVARSRIHIHTRWLVLSIIIKKKSVETWQFYLRGKQLKRRVINHASNGC